MIKVENVSKSFDFVKAVKDVSFEAEPGKILGFLGPNGAGKTTTMRMIAGFLASDRGRILINGIDIAKDPIAVQKHIGYLPENNPLYKDMQVAELLDLAADLNGVPKNKRRKALEFVVKAVGIKDVFYRPAGELSKGYKQRVGIAMALIHNPKIIIMDEPTEGLDPNQRKEIRVLIKKLAEKHTIILSTHVMQEASAVCDRMLIINKGKIVADGTAKELSQKAKSEKTILVEIEGKGVEKGLEGLINNVGIRHGVSHCDVSLRENRKGRIVGKLTCGRDDELQPEISKLARERNWIIWKILEEEHNLEDIFQSLTK